MNEAPAGPSANRRELIELLWEKERRQHKTGGNDLGKITPRIRDGGDQLSYSQEQLWFLKALNPHDAANNINAAARLDGVLDKVLLRKCIETIVERHEVLRTRFIAENGSARAVVVSPGALDWCEVDLTGLPAEARAGSLDERLRMQAGRPFDLGGDALVRVILFEVNAVQHVLFVCVHHIVADGWSMSVLLGEVAALYGAYVQDEAASLAALPLQYADFALWQRRWLEGQFLDRLVTYWKERLSGAPVALSLATDRPRPSVAGYAGDTVTVALPRDLSRRLVELGRATGTTLYMVLLAAYQVLLGRYSGQEDIVVGSPIAGRRRQELEGLIGFFVNTLAMRTDLSGDPTFRDLLGRVKETALGAYAHQDLPFEKLVEALQPVRDLSRQPVFQTMFGLQSIPTKPITLPELEIVPLGEIVVASKFDLSLFLWETGEGLRGYFEYATALFDRSTIERLSEHLQVLLEGIVRDPGRRLSDLPLLGASERRRVVEEWNDTAASYPSDRCLHELFAAQAARTPEAVALVFGEQRLSYGELDRRSNRLAHHLRGLGVGPETIVGLCVERSLEMVVGLLGILKAGGAYLPLDPEYPPERLAYMVSDAAAPVVVTQAGLEAGLPAHGARVVRLDADWERIDLCPATAPPAAAGPHNLAYVIYTSGSTGRPKGVMIQHRSVVSFLSSMSTSPGLDSSDVLAAVTPLSFDIAGLEIYLPLVRGARVVILPRSIGLDGTLLKDWLARSGATIMQATPSGWRLLKEAGWSGGRLKALCGGEAMPPDVAAYLSENAGKAWNLYGPTETTIWSSACELEANGLVTLGRPIANTQLYVLDAVLEPVPVGVRGELYIGGAGLARGYLGRADLTAERFVASPFGTGERLYRTGDAARWLADGTLEYLGRLDHQVKVRGYRIELGEIEAALVEQAGVAQAVVVAREEAAGDRRLVAYVCPKSEDSADFDQRMSFGLFYFAEGKPGASNSEIYRLYLEGARRADELGLDAIWTPERHFTEVAAAYPNPSVLSAALAMVTERIHLRAGSVVLPLHDPLRVAEEWAVVDHLSNGRVGIAFAPGWVPDDFVFAPENYEDRTTITSEYLEIVRRLWRGGTLVRKNGTGVEVEAVTLPRPVQKELPAWLTTGGSRSSFELAGRLGVNVLTALLNQSLEELAENISHYRASLAKHGHGPSGFTVTVMLHSFVAETDELALSHAREPLRQYLKSHARLRDSLIKRASLGIAQADADVDIDTLLDEILKRYLMQASLIGAPESCVRLVERLHAIGVGEVACLLDFGIDVEHILKNLTYLRRLRDCGNLRINRHALRDRLADRLPPYMMVTDIVVLDQFPLTPNGKVDRRKLQERAAAPESSIHVAPRSATESKLAAIWARILRREKVGLRDNFFELGGHSLQAMQVADQIRKAFGVDIRLRDLFEAPTIERISQRIDQAEPARLDERESEFVPNQEPAARYSSFPLTDIQQAYWIGRGPAFPLGNVAAHSYFEFESDDLEVGRFQSALQRVIERHDMLRAVILPTGLQQVLETTPPYEVVRLDLRHLAEGAIFNELDALRNRMSHQIHDATRWPLFEFVVTLLPGGKSRLHVSFDILIGDARSFQIFIGDLSRFYADPQVSLKPIECTFRDYVLATQQSRDGERYAAAKKYWEERTRTLPLAPTLPLARKLTEISTPRFNRLSEVMDMATWRALQALGQRIGLTPAAVLLAAFADVISVYSGDQNFTINLIVFNRRQIPSAEIDTVIGDFTSMSLLEVDFSVRSSFATRARQLQKRLWQDLDHNDVNGIDVLRALSRREGRVVTIPVVFTSLLGTGFDTHERPSLPAQSRLTYTITQTPQVALDCQISETDEGLSIAWDVVTEAFPEGFPATMFSQFVASVARLAAAEGRWEESDRRLLPASQLAQRVAVNDTNVPRPKLLLDAPFLRQAALRPDATAIITSGRQISYRELESRTRRIASRLTQLGVRRNEVVAVIMDRGWEQIVAVLAILRAGAAYLPIDARLPEERRAYLVTHAEAKVILSQSWLRDVGEGGCIPMIMVDHEPEAEAVWDDALDGRSDEDVAYVIYTSGSTGTPKGVVISHRGAANTILDINERCSVSEQDRVLGVSSLSFDLSVYDIFGILAAGGAIVMPDAADHPDPAHWLSIALTENVTIWNSVPALLELLLEEAERRSAGLGSLRLVMQSGDWIPITLPDRLRRSAPMAKFLAMGGATEASIWSIYTWVDSVDQAWSSIPYGKPLTNQSFHVLNGLLEPCPVWTEGDLYIGGIGLSLGYLKDEDRTKTSFIVHPQTGQRLYQTGDRGRYLPSGEIEFLGRRDHQVKIQGHRIELGEIEAALARCPAVREGVVAARGHVRGGQRLVGYVVLGSNAETEDARRFLRAKLPAYMVPDTFVVLDRLPLSANGKVDRQALPIADLGKTSQESFTAPRNELEQEISTIWTEVLHSPSPGIHTNFFELGGESVSLLRVRAAIISKLNREIPVTVFFEHPTIASLSEYLGTPSDRSGSVPSSRKRGMARRERLQQQHRRQAKSEEDAADHGNDPTALTPDLAIFLGDRGTSWRKHVEEDWSGILTDSVERDRFKSRRLGVRVAPTEAHYVPLGERQETLSDVTLLGRHSARRFSAGAVTRKALGRLLECLESRLIGGRIKHRYASAGGLYPVQVYLTIRSEKSGTQASDIASGAYYYDPDRHLLHLLSESEPSKVSMHLAINQPVFLESTFSLFLVSAQAAIAPIYGAEGLRFALLEAGMIAQLLDQSAKHCGIGLCHVGGVDFAPYRAAFQLDDSHVLLHSYLGGRLYGGEQ